MSILDDKLENIINSSRINFYNKEIKEDLNNRKLNLDIVNEINKIWNSIKGNSRLAIYGAGNHTMKLFEIVNRYDKNIICIIDNLKANGEFLGYPLIDKEQIKKYNLDEIVISTLGYGKEIKEDIIRNFPNIKVIDIYEKLKAIGYDINKPFYYHKLVEKYLVIYEVKNIYKRSKDEKYLANLIFLYLDIKDFSNAFKYILEYIDKGYIQYEKFKFLYKELNEFNIHIKKQLWKIKNKNLLMILVDSLRWKDIFEYDNMKYVKSISRKSLNLTNAYTHVPYTSMSILSMITGKKMFDDNLMNIKMPINSPNILNDINNTDYKFKYYGNQLQLFTQEFCNQSYDTNISQLLWDYICDSYEGKNGQNISIVHIMEVHAPHICGNHKYKPIDFGGYASSHLTDYEVFIQKIQYNETLDYVDKQLKYYCDLINDETTLIITSDHGMTLEWDIKSKNDNQFIEDFTHIPYIILEKNMSPKVERRLISHIDSHKIIYNLIHKKPIFYKVQKREFIEINKDFAYSKILLENLSKLNKMHIARAFKCFRSETEKYVVYYDGTEEFYILPNEDNNLIGDIKYKKRVEEIKLMVNSKLPNFNEERFKYAREVLKK